MSSLDLGEKNWGKDNSDWIVNNSLHLKKVIVANVEEWTFTSDTKISAYMCSEVRNCWGDGEEGMDSNRTVSQPCGQEHQNTKASEDFGSSL